MKDDCELYIENGGMCDPCHGCREDCASRAFLNCNCGFQFSCGYFGDTRDGWNCPCKKCGDYK